MTVAGPVGADPVNLEGQPLQSLSETMDANFVNFCTRNFQRLKDMLTARFNAPTQTTVGAAGAASALPATPVGYLQVPIGGVMYVVPYYNQA